MAGIAHNLDERERALMAENGVDSAAFLAHMAADSSNVDDSGNYSIEVLSTCLKNLGFECVNIQHERCAHVRANMAAQTGFICNLQSHWLALRRINGLWFNLNSLQSDNDGWGPTYCSDFALLALIDSLRERRFSIFVVTPTDGESNANGGWPPADTGAEVAGRGGKWFDSREIVAATKSGFKKQKLAHGGGSNADQVARLMAPGGAAAGDRQLAQALAMSMAQESRQSGGSTSIPASLTDPNALSSPSMGGSFGGGGGSSAAAAAGNGGGGGGGGFDDDLARALAASMEDVQPKRKSPGGVPASSSSGSPSPPPAAAAAVAAPVVGGEQRNPALSAREAAAAAALKRVAAAAASAAPPATAANVSSSAAPASSSTSPPAAAAADAASASPDAAAAAPASAPAPDASAVAASSPAPDDGMDDAEEREQLRLAMEMSMQQPPADAAAN
jgi:hypothetical protein